MAVHKKMINKKAQIWIEVVIYFLIGLALISLVLAFLLPEINQTIDRIIIEQTIEDMNNIDVSMRDVTYALGNVRTRKFRIKKGGLVIDCLSDSIFFELENSRKEFSEPGTPVSLGFLNILTLKEGEDRYNIKLLLNYSEYLNLSLSGKQDVMTFPRASSVYEISIENTGYNNTLNITHINILDIS